MEFTIVGAGALGTIFGAHLVAAGHTVHMVARGQRAANLRAHGLRVKGLVDLHSPCEVVTDPGTINATDVLIYAVKTYHMEDAIAGLARAAPGAVFSVANGVMKNEQLSNAYGAGKVLGCMADTSGELHADGTVEFTRNVCTNLGALHQSCAADVSAIARSIDDAGVVTKSVDDITSVEWSKFVAWVAMFSVSVLSRRFTGQYLANRELARAVLAQMREAGAVADDLGVRLNDDAPLPVATILASDDETAVGLIVERGELVLANAPSHRMSGLQDLEAGRKLEVHDTLGYLVRKGSASGNAVPSLALAYYLTAGLDALQ